MRTWLDLLLDQYYEALGQPQQLIRYGKEEKDRYSYEIRLPGVELEDIILSMEDGCLVQQVSDKCTRGYSPRAIYLPKDADTGKIEATLKNGILTVVVYKRERSKAKQIPIKLG